MSSPGSAADPHAADPPATDPPAADPPAADPPADDPLHGHSSAEPTWATTNLAEAMPGVPTPLGWTFWAAGIELAIRAGFHAIGALRKDETGPPASEADRVYNIFYGRAAVRVDFFCQVGDRMPGTSGEAVAREWFSCVPAGHRPDPTRRRYPVIAAAMPVTMAGLPRRMRRLRAETDRWWRAEVASADGLDLEQARARFTEATTRFNATMRMHSIALMAGVQPAHQQVTRVFGPDVPMVGMGSHEEMRMVADLWACSRGELPIETVVARYGFHGPTEGELSGTVWRMDPTPLLRIIEGYRRLPDTAAPAEADAGREAARRAVSALPTHRRPLGLATLKLARTYLPLRGVGKVAFLQTVDVARAAATRMGSLLTDAGVLPDASDVFYLTADELSGPRLPTDVAELVAHRRVDRQGYEKLDVPGTWQGMPEPVVPTASAATTDVLTGLGVSPGVVRGRVRVIHDPADADIEPGEILVAHTTDPSWAAVMFPSAGLIVDIGGTLSHAAVVARELGLPCVMDTTIGTRTLRTGDEVELDGRTGTVRILRRLRTAHV